MKNEPHDEQLTTLLHCWRVDVEPTPRFSKDVWCRIARREAEAEASSWPTRWQRWVECLSRRTSLAWVAASMVVTVGAGLMGLRPSPSHQASAPTSSAYLASIDPYRMTR